MLMLMMMMMMMMLMMLMRSIQWLVSDHVLFVSRTRRILPRPIPQRSCTSCLKKFNK